MPAGDDDGVGLVTILRADGDASQVEHVEGVGIEGLVGERKADQVEFGQGSFRFERIEGNAMLTHQRFHVQPGRIGAFSQRVLALVDLVVQDFQAHVRDADIVNIREDKGDAGLDAVPILDHAVQLAADIPAGFLYF